MTRFMGEIPNKPFDVTADWLWAKVDGGPRCQIKGKWFYILDDELTGNIKQRRKYRFLGRLVNKYMFRIVALK